MTRHWGGKAPACTTAVHHYLALHQSPSTCSSAHAMHAAQDAAMHYPCTPETAQEPREASGQACGHAMAPLPELQPAPVRGVRLGAAATKVALAPPWALLGHRVVLRTMYTWSLGVAIASWLRFHVLRGDVRMITLRKQEHACRATDAQAG